MFSVIPPPFVRANDSGDGSNLCQLYIEGVVALRAVTEKPSVLPDTDRLRVHIPIVVKMPVNVWVVETSVANVWLPAVVVNVQPEPLVTVIVTWDVVIPSEKTGTVMVVQPGGITTLDSSAVRYGKAIPDVPPQIRARGTILTTDSHATGTREGADVVGGSVDIVGGAVGPCIGATLVGLVVGVADEVGKCTGVEVGVNTGSRCCLLCEFTPCEPIVLVPGARATAFWYSGPALNIRAVVMERVPRARV